MINIINLPFVFLYSTGKAPRCLTKVAQTHVSTYSKRCSKQTYETELPSSFFSSNFDVKEIKAPILHKPVIYDEPKMPSVEIRYSPFQIVLQLPTFNHSGENNIVGDFNTGNDVFASSLIKKRRKKMNKHKYKKRIDRDIAKIRKIRGFRLRKKRGRQAHKKALLVKKLSKVLKKNPKADLPNRPYVMYRLKHW